jgi:hypothetical protein
VVFSGKRKVIRNGKKRNHVWRSSYAKHMAVIAEVHEGGRSLVLLHQNVGPTDAPASEREVVQATTLDLRTQRPGGTIRISRPMAAESVSRIEWPGKT